jgi:hypothetical protein
MPHVDEGQLHAYLDRGPGDATASEWATFESHLSLCEDCQGRMEEARRLRDRAQEILARVGPGDIEVPPFESLVARSAAGGGSSGGSSRPIGPGSTLRRRWRSGNIPLAWAATIMVAVGAGWMARQVTMSSAEFGSLAERPASEVFTDNIETAPEPAATETAIAGQESQDRLLATVDDEAAGRRANEAIEADRANNRAELPSNRAVGLPDAADQRVAAKSVVVAEAERRDGAEEEAVREALPVTRDLVAQADADNQRKVGGDAAGEADAEGKADAVSVGALARRVALEEAVAAAGHAALGCYALEVEWSQAGAPPVPARVQLRARRAQLLAEAVTPDPSGGDYYRIAAVGRAYEVRADPASGAKPAYWLPFGPDSVLVRVPSETTVLELRLQLTEGELHGVANVVSPEFADADQAAGVGDAALDGPTAVARGSVRGRGIDCSEMD